MTDHVVTAMGGGIAHPLIVATERVQRDRLVELALKESDHSNHTGLAVRTHSNVSFYVWDRPVGIGQGAPRRWLQVGFHGGFGGVLFYDDPRSPTDQQSVTSEDWAWVALRPQPLNDPPVVYFDQESGTEFPPAAVMSVDELQAVVKEWVHGGERPGSVEWLRVNALRWRLSEAGEVIFGQQAM